MINRRRSILSLYYIFPIALILLTPVISSLATITTDDSSDYTFSEQNIGSQNTKHSVEQTDQGARLGLILGLEMALFLVGGIFVLSDIYKISQKISFYHNDIRAPPAFGPELSNY